MGKDSQLALKKSRVLVLGAGGIGSALLPYLASSGIGYIRLLDPDTVEESNLSRQILFNDNHVGALKGPTAVEFLTSLNSNLEIDWLPGRFNEASSHQVESMDLILEGTDDLPCKFLVSDMALQKNIPAIIGSIGNVQGHVFPVAARPNHACYRCLFEKPPEEEIPTCATEGILSPLPGIIGSMMAYLAIEYLSGRAGREFLRKIYLMESSGWRTMKLEQNRQCSCSTNINS